MRLYVLTAALLSLAATSAWSQEVISTASAADAHPPGVHAPPPGPLNTRRPGIVSDSTEVPAMPCSVAGDNRPHGEVSVGVGTGGYRAAGGSVCAPIGPGSTVQISGGESQGRWGR